MKKNIVTLALLLSCSFIIAQTEFDALKYVQTDINGTARYMSMAGAFGALGGDASAIKDNPAGLGIYRKSELSGTLNVLVQNSTSNWQYYNGSNLKNSFGYGDLYKIGANNFSLVLASPTWRNESQADGLLSSNWSFAYNRLKNFDKNVYMKSGPSNSSISDYMAYFSEGNNSSDFYYNQDINELFNSNLSTLSIYGYQGYLIDSVSDRSWRSSIYNNKITPTCNLTERGYVDEYSIGWAGNFSNKFYFGATANFQSLNYSATTNYSESFGNEGNLFLGDSIYSKGTGVNLKIGAIVSLTDFLRFGLSFQTPTILSMNDSYYSTLVYNRADIVRHGTIVAPVFNNYYQIQSPMKIDASVAYIIGNKGLISAEYVYNNYAGTRLMSDKGNYQAYIDENQGMRDFMNNTRTIKIGGEYKLTDNFSIRAGFANTNNETKPTAEKLLQPYTKSVDTRYFLQNSTNYLTAGFGYREAGWFIDFAYMNKVLDETFYPYNTNNLAKTYPDYAVNPVSVITSNNNVVVTLGFKF
jgi:hypothetical protein